VVENIFAVLMNEAYTVLHSMKHVGSTKLITVCPTRETLDNDMMI